MTKNIAATIYELIDEKQDSDKCNVKIVAANIGTTEKRFRNCLSGLAEFKASEIIEMADYFGVSTDRILTGSEEKNRTIAKELGLSDSSISYLKELKSREYDYQESFVETADVMSASRDNLKVPIDKPIMEGSTTAEVLFILNWILSNNSGHNLLSMIAKYCLVDASQGLIYDRYIESDSPLEECEEVYFKNRIGEGYTMFNPAVLRYALIPAITDEISSIRDQILKGEMK